MIGTTTLADYLVKAGERLPEEANRVLEALINEGNMNKEDLSLLSRVKRAVLDHVIMQLYALGLVDVSTEGKSKICSLTKLGEEYLVLVDEKKAG
ncbi:TFIIE alpha subunit [Desulfotomaculum arcticum]|uniref:TFIIE alpha subunit n=1 Tax=Desulfotruncus arcticus DSM 17038 TaxID=1121424 RepID=A0A1I2WF67_9FIRM|nr:transcriptional regulator [Desulfotruncus arcticus]SFG99943.1 TFIIE alpha subunit [Desulfotomaculum arcticum] [Desulfotruncus arcticus DSM 17038]